MDPLKVVPITNELHVEMLRYLRNLTTAGFSHFNGFIEYETQQAWWRTMDFRVRGWLYMTNDTPRQLAGYGVLRVEDGRWWNSVAVHPDQQGHGYGSFITHDLIGRHDSEIFSAIRRDNTAAMAMHHADDWREIEGPEPDRLIYLISRVP